MTDNLWADITPIDQDDGPNPVVPIAYPTAYRKLMGYFRAFMKNGERSPRVLALTADLLEHNAAHYTVWHIRRQCLFALAESDETVLRDEMDYAAEVATSNPKNYQIWYHRRALVERVGPELAVPELAFIADMLVGDAKNYHAWSHRLWVLQTYDCWGGELEFTRGLHDDDVYNNSAWNHRYSVVTMSGGPPDSSVCVREVAYAVDRVSGAEENESAWVYAVAFAKKDPAAFAKLLEYCDAALNEPWGPQSATLHATLVELYATKEATRAAEYARKLATELDPPRAKYWLNKSEKLVPAN